MVALDGCFERLVGYFKVVVCSTRKKPLASAISCTTDGSAGSSPLEHAVIYANFQTMACMLKEMI